jgi:4-methyl-5(b-hydroxyethyl)-thiazole monophosphate biosynthesis
MGAVKHAVVVLAEGFEEIEAITCIDVLRRAGVDVRVAGLAGKGQAVRGAHDITIKVDVQLAEVSDESMDMLVLPGGMPGTRNLAADECLLALIRRSAESGKWLAAVCAAPTVLHAAGVLSGRRVTSYPSCSQQLTGASYVSEAVVRDGNIITSRGVGTALAFALELVRVLVGNEKAEELAAAMLVKS